MNGISYVKKALLTGGVEEASYRQIREKLHESNRRTLLVFSYIAMSALFLMCAASFCVDTMATYRAVYFSGLVISVVIWAIAQYPGRTRLSLLTADVYIFDALLLAIGIVMGTVLGPNELGATFIALLLAVPQLFTDRPWRMHILTFAAAVVFIVMANIYKDPATVGADIVNTVMFGLFSIALSTFSITNRVRRYALEYEIRFLAENDQLTGLKNRYCYQQYLNNTDILRSNSIYCVYVDANGLHELNNTKGHEAGDRMLQFVAAVMQNLFGKDCTYRIGGDEFVALGMDRSCAEVEELVSEMKKAIETAGYHVAAGIGLREKLEVDVDSLVKSAEEKMYKDKAEYYRAAGKDRDGRQIQ